MGKRLPPGVGESRMSTKINFGKLSIEIEELRNEVIYRFVGDVDEHFKQKDLPRIKKDHITFLLEDVLTFNSCGIREWIFLIRDIELCGELKFKRCSVAMVDQINMVPESLGKGTIESFD
jgi:hypothetical protein